MQWLVSWSVFDVGRDEASFLLGVCLLSGLQILSGWTFSIKPFVWLGRVLLSVPVQLGGSRWERVVPKERTKPKPVTQSSSLRRADVLWKTAWASSISSFANWSLNSRTSFYIIFVFYIKHQKMDWKSVNSLNCTINFSIKHPSTVLLAFLHFYAYAICLISTLTRKSTIFSIFKVLFTTNLHSCEGAKKILIKIFVNAKAEPNRNDIEPTNAQCDVGSALSLSLLSFARTFCIYCFAFGSIR